MLGLPESAAAGAINYGFPVIADTDIPQILPTGVCTYEHVVSRVPYETIVEKALKVRGCKVKITKVPIPVPYRSGLRGGTDSEGDVQVEFGGNRSTAFEFVRMVPVGRPQRWRDPVIGSDLDQVEPGSALTTSPLMKNTANTAVRK